MALATVKLKSLISEDAVQLGSKRVSAREMRSVSSGESKDCGACWRRTPVSALPPGPMAPPQLSTCSEETGAAHQLQCKVKPCFNWTRHFQLGQKQVSVRAKRVTRWHPTSCSVSFSNCLRTTRINSCGWTTNHQ